MMQSRSVVEGALYVGWAETWRGPHVLFFLLLVGLEDSTHPYGNLTQVTQYPGGGAAIRVTQFWYNCEDEKVAEKDGVSEDEDDGVNRPLTVWTYDNLGETTET